MPVFQYAQNEAKLSVVLTAIYAGLSLYVYKSRDPWSFKPYDWQTYTSHSRSKLPNEKLINYKRKITTNDCMEMIEFTLWHTESNEKLSIEEALHVLTTRFEIKPDELFLYKISYVNDGKEIILTREIKHDQKRIDDPNTIQSTKRILGFIAFTSIVYCVGKEVYGRYIGSHS
jgi:predicted phosphoadenosine phosphosulfate sulfurtransferase